MGMENVKIQENDKEDFEKFNKLVKLTFKDQHLRKLLVKFIEDVDNTINKIQNINEKLQTNYIKINNDKNLPEKTQTDDAIMQYELTKNTPQEESLKGKESLEKKGKELFTTSYKKQTFENAFDDHDLYEKKHKQ